MRKLFLTSGVILCMACPAIATDIPASGGATCTYTYLGDYEGPVSYNAKWTAKSFNIIYHPGNAKACSSCTVRTPSQTNTKSVSVTYDSSAGTALQNTATDLGTAYSLTGYTFNGWKADYEISSGNGALFTNEWYEGGTNYSAGASLGTYKVAGNTNMYAQWTPNCYNSITLNSNMYTGTSGNPKYSVNSSPASLSIKYDVGAFTNNCASTQSITKPTLTGYTFGGYYNSRTNAVAASPAASTQMITADDTPAVTSYGKTITSGSTEWYARWTPVTVSNGLKYSCGTAPTVAGTQLSFSTSNGGNTPPPSVNTTYDSSYTIAATTTCALTGSGSTGYHWGGWSCKNNPENNSTTAAVYESTYSSTNSRYEVSKTVSEWKATSAVTCTAQWAGNTYKVTFNKNTKDVNGADLVTTAGAALTPSGTMSKESFTYNVKKALTTNTYTAACYDFSGWTSNKTLTTVAGSGTPTYTNGQDIDKYIYPGDATLTARWTPKTSGTISLVNSVYPSNNRSSAATYTTSHATEPVTAQTTTQVHTVFNTAMYANASGTTAITAANMIPVKKGYSFNGFFASSDSSGSTAYIDSSGNPTAAGKRAACDSTATWYANWTKKKYNVTYQAGTHGTGSNYTHSNGAEYDSAYTTRTLAQTSITANTGYSFAGWKGANIDGSSSSVTYSGGTNIGTWKIDGGNTFTAQWTANCYGGTNGIVLVSSYYATADAATYTTSSAAPNKVTASSPTTIWTKYDSSSFFSSSANCTAGTTATFTKPTLTGYTFKGFFDTLAHAVTGNGGSSTTGQMIDSNGALTTAGKTNTSSGTTWYAAWKPISKTLTYDCGTAPSGTMGGTAPTAVTLTYDQSYSLSATPGSCAISGAGYHFTGWRCTKNLATDADNSVTGQTPNYEAACGSTDATINTCSLASATASFKSKVTANVTCYATWAPNTVKPISWSGNGGSTPSGGATQCTYDGGLTTPTAPTRTGYTFGGWCVSGSSGCTTN